MFCPNCREEYREGFYRCGECQVDLVHTLEAAGAAAEPALAPLLETQHPDLLHELVDRLEAAEIPYAVQAGTGLSHLERPTLLDQTRPEPWRGLVWVPGACLERARPILDELRRSAQDSERARRRIHPPPSSGGEVPE